MGCRSFNILFQLLISLGPGYNECCPLPEAVTLTQSRRVWRLRPYPCWCGFQCWQQSVVGYGAGQFPRCRYYNNVLDLHQRYSQMYRSSPLPETCQHKRGTLAYKLGFWSPSSSLGRLLSSQDRILGTTQHPHRVISVFFQRWQVIKKKLTFHFISFHNTLK